MAYVIVCSLGLVSSCTVVLEAIGLPARPKLTEGNFAHNLFTKELLIDHKFYEGKFFQVQQLEEYDQGVRVKRIISDVAGLAARLASEPDTQTLQPTSRVNVYVEFKRAGIQIFRMFAEAGVRNCYGCVVTNAGSGDGVMLPWGTGYTRLDVIGYLVSALENKRIVATKEQIDRLGAALNDYKLATAAGSDNPDSLLEMKHEALTVALSLGVHYCSHLSMNLPRKHKENPLAWFVR
jgi:hypothetical protein